MTCNELIKALQKLQEQGYGNSPVIYGVNSAGLDIDSANVAYSEDGETADIILE